MDDLAEHELRKHLLLGGMREGLSYKHYVDGDPSRLTERFKSVLERNFRKLIDLVDLRSLEDDQVAKWLLVQSMEGQAQNGHLLFRNNSYTEVLIEDIVRGLNWNPKEVKKGREQLMMQIFDFVNRVLDGKAKRYVTKDNNPLLGLRFLRDFQIQDPQALLKGMVLASYMDNDKTRLKTLKRYNHKDYLGKKLELGCGRCLPVDLKEMYKLRLDAIFFQENEIGNNLERMLTEEGVIVPNQKDQKGKLVQQIYFRTKIGPGISDDAAMIYIGKKYGVDAMLGAFLVDAMDTYDKYCQSVLPGGWDEHIGKYIEAALEHIAKVIIATDEEKMAVIYNGAKGNTPRLKVSCSHRRFVETPRGGLKPAILNHIAHVKGEPTENVRVGYAQTSAKYLYHACDRREQYESRRAA